MINLSWLSVITYHDILDEFLIRKGAFVALSPKAYYCFNQEDNKTKTAHKGKYRITKLLFHRYSGVCYAESKRLTLEDYLNSLFEGTSFQAVNRGFKVNKDHQMMYYEQVKEGLNPVFIKFDLEDDLITCKPLKSNGQYM